MTRNRQTIVFFRNDDVNRMEPGLVEITRVLAGRGVGISHAVEPANLTDEVRDWLLAERVRGVEIVQHGFAHIEHDRGEFGGSRSAADQRADLAEGLRIMREAFGEHFFPAMSFPFGLYNEHSVPLIEELGYKVLTSHVRHQFRRRVYYFLGRLLKRGRWLGRHVSHHLSTYPGTRILEVSVAISPISRYDVEAGPTACEFHSLETMLAMFRTCRRQSPVVGIVLHHRYHADAQSLKLLGDLVDKLNAEPGVSFMDLAGIHARFANPSGATR